MARVDDVADRVAEPEHEERHRIDTHRNRRIALLHLQIGGLGRADSLRHHHCGQVALSARGGDVAPELGQRTAHLWRKRLQGRRLHDKVSWNSLIATYGIVYKTLNWLSPPFALHSSRCWAAPRLAKSPAQ